jgi:hypothetical protein
MQDLHPASIVVGACILLVIALLPVRASSGKRWAFTGFILATLATLFLMDAGLGLSGFVVDFTDEQILKANMDRVQADFTGHTPRNLLVLEGSSQSALGLDAGRIEDDLRHAGYDVTVVDLAISGGNLLERYTLMRRFTAEMHQRGIPYPANTRVLFELHPQYDRDPLRFFSYYKDTLQTYYYSRFSNFFYAWHAYRDAGGAVDKLALTTFGDFFSHCMVWTFKIGMLPKMQEFDRLTPMQPFTPFDGPPARGTYKQQDFPDLRTRYRPGVVHVDAIDRRTQRAAALFGDNLSGEGFFLVPSRDPRKMDYGHRACGMALAPVCIDSSGPDIYGALPGKTSYYDRDHLNTGGARIYSDWFAQQLIAQQAVVK